jgi:hypothetical protein
MTLEPNKHSNPDQTIIAASALLLKTLMKSGVEEYDKLEEVVEAKIEDGKYLFLPALNLLYVLGVIEYHKKSDVFEYVGASR